MQNLLFDELCIKRTKKLFWMFEMACVAILSVVYTPLYLLLSSNVVWRGSVLLFLMTELIEPLIDFAFYWGSFAFLIYVYLRFGKKKIGKFVLIYIAAVLAKYLLTLLAGYLMMSFPNSTAFWSEEVPSALFSIGMDCLQMLVVLLLTNFCCRRPMLLAKRYPKGAEGEEMLADCFPIEGLFRLKKPLPKLCFFAALVPSGVRVLSRLYYDIFFWGLPTDASEWLLIATYYIGDIATLFIGYFVLLYLMQMFYTEETKKKIEFES